MENTQDLGPLTEQVQVWWNAKHASCGIEPEFDPFGQDSGSLSFLFRNEDLVRFPVICPSTCGWRGDQTRQNLVLELQRSISTSAVKSAGLLSQPNEEVAEEVASSLLPTPWGTELTFVTDIVKAAGAQNAFQRRQALKGAGVAIATIVGFGLLGLGKRKAA